MIKYGYTILYVDSVEETLAFYAKAFGFTQKLLTPDKDYGELDTGGTTLAFAKHAIAEYNGITMSKLNSELPVAPFEITFVTEDIENTWEQAIDAGATVVKEPAPKPWGQTVAYLRDINGFLVELCTPVKA